MKYLIRLRYVGTAYCGFQVQKNEPSIQKELQNAAEKLLGVECKVSGCSRTDAKVHANDYVATVECEREKNIPAENFPKAINTYLLDDITVFSAKIVDDDFNLRHNVIKKEYLYKIYAAEYKNPFWRDRALFYHKEIDLDLMNQALKEMCGTHDFASFCAANSSVLDTTRTVYHAYAEKKDDIIEIYVCGDGFLYNMVRIMVGTALFVNEGKIKVSEIKDIIASKNRENAGITAQAQGLYLNKVYIKE